jgi:hypothetical protein
VTGLLDCLLDKNYTAANEHGGMRTIRSLLEDSKELAVPVVDLVAILPDLKSQARRGLHIASYYALDDKNWYPELLTTFFTRGVGGSLLALRQFAKCIGEYRVQRATKPRGKAKPLKADLVSMSAFFPPHPKILEYSVNDRFNEYSNLLFNHFDDHAAVVWVCFGPRGENSIQWAGSLFLLVRPLSGTEWRDETIRRAVESVYSVLDASFHRAIVNTAYRQEAKHQLELTYFAFGHELKNRIDALRMGELSNKVHASAPKLIPDVDRCRDRLRTLRGMAGVFSIVAKSQDGVLPPTWVSASKIPAPPDVPTEKQCEELKAALSSAVAAFWYLEDAEELLVLRQINGGCATEVKRPSAFQATPLPPFNAENLEPHLCFLSGLAELCRNAAKVVLTASPKHDRPHIDFAVDVSRDVAFKATVTIFNPVAGDQYKPSESVGILADLFKCLNSIVELEQAEVLESYPYALSGDAYVSSRFLFFPKRIRVAASPYIPSEAL